MATTTQEPELAQPATLQLGLVLPLSLSIATTLAGVYVTAYEPQRAWLARVRILTIRLTQLAVRQSSPSVCQSLKGSERAWQCQMPSNIRFWPRPRRGVEYAGSGAFAHRGQGWPPTCWLPPWTALGRLPAPCDGNGNPRAFDHSFARARINRLLIATNHRRRQFCRAQPIG